ncbi:MAG: hypothetical protein COC24_014930 [Alphaproteobacteria bacterium]|nr:hypothetical protein [Alphaproteobacteria bacterium]
MNLEMTNRKRRQDLDFSNQEVEVYDFKRDRIVCKIDFEHIDFGNIIGQSSYTRTSDTLMIDAQGIYCTFPTNAAAQTNLGMKISPRVENLLHGNNNFSGSDWYKIDESIVCESNAALAPNGSITAQRVSNFADGSGDKIRQGVNGVALKTFNAAISVKGEGSDIGNELSLQIKQNSGTLVYDSQSIILTSEWQRYSVSTAFLADNDGCYFLLRATNSIADSANSFLAWGAQLELGSFANDPVITAVGVTGVSDKITVYDDLSGYDLSEGGLFIEFDFHHASGNSRIVELGDGASRLVFFVADGSTNDAYIGNDYHAANDYTSVFNLAYGRHKAFIKWTDTEIKFFMDGALINTLSLATPFTSNDFTRLSFASTYSGGLQSVIDFIKGVIYDVAPIDEQCVELTS